MSDTSTVCEEHPEDFPRIAEILDSAFDGTYESKLVDAIRSSSSYVNDLSLVARSGDKATGYIMLSYVDVETVEWSRKVLALGPVAVTPEHQNQSIGSRLIRRALSVADGMSVDTIVLLGHPEYYPRFGFVPASDLDIYPPLPWSDNAFMARTAPGKSGIRGGVVHYQDHWGIDQRFERARVELRPARDQDIEQVSRTFKISFRHALPFLPVLHSAADDLEYFKKTVFVQNEVWVAEAKGEGSESSVVGFIAFNDEFINQLYVLPFTRGRAIGSDLLKVALGKSKPLKLWTFQRNTGALRFYERHGFVEVKRTDGADNEEREPDVMLEWNR